MSHEYALTAAEDVAHLYPWARWAEPEEAQLKALLLFFDRIAVLLPESEWTKYERRPDFPELLADQGFLEFLDPAEVVDGRAAELLASELLRHVADGRFAESAVTLGNNTRFRNAEGVPLLRGKFGMQADPALADWVIQELIAAGLAGLDEDLTSYVKVPSEVGGFVLALLGQLVPRLASMPNSVLHPVTNDYWNLQRIRPLLAPPNPGSVARLVQDDLRTVDIDLSSVPLRTIIEARQEHRQLLRAYMADVRSFARSEAEAGELSEAEARTLQVEDQVFAALRLRERHRTRRRWRIALGFTGAAWTATSGDFVGGALAASIAMLGMQPHQERSASYMYLVKLKETIDP